MSARPPQDVDVLAVRVLGRPGNFRKLTSSDVLVPGPRPVRPRLKNSQTLTSSDPRSGRPRPPASYEN